MKDLINLPIPSDHIVCDLMMDQLILSAVVVADELEVFTQINSGISTKTALADSLRCHVRSIEVLLNALTTAGFLSFDDQKYYLTEVCQAYFLRGSPTNRIFQFHSNKVTWSYNRILGMIKNGPDPLAQGPKSLTSMWENNTLTQEAANRFTAMMNTNISAVAISIAKSGLFKEFSNVVDVGGGSGIFLAAMRQMYPEKMLTLFELPQVCEAAKGIIKHYIDPNSINYFPGSFFETTWPFEQRAYFLSNILHDWPLDKAQLILKNIYQAIKPGGSLFINEALLNPGRLTPKHTVLFDLMMHLNHNSQQFTFEELCALVQSVGFQKPKKVFEFGYYSVLRADKTTN